VIADLHSPELAGAVVPYLVGFTDWDVVDGHSHFFQSNDCRW
jgi:hypothetical protein